MTMDEKRLTEIKQQRQAWLDGSTADRLDLSRPLIIVAMKELLDAISLGISSAPHSFVRPKPFAPGCVICGKFASNNIHAVSS